MDNLSPGKQASILKLRINKRGMFGTEAYREMPLETPGSPVTYRLGKVKRAVLPSALLSNVDNPSIMGLKRESNVLPSATATAACKVARVVRTCSP